MEAPVDERITDEIEALQAILMNDVVVKKVGNVPNIIETVVHPSTGDDVDQQYVCVTLEVMLTPEYPDSSPQVTLRNPRGLSEELLTTIHSQIRNKLKDCLGQPVIFELIELIREYLTQKNLPSGQCVICLYGFTNGDVFIKTQCYHHFHNHCLASHLIADKKNYQEEFDKLPNWKQMEEPPYQQTCPVCRCKMSFDVETLKKAPPPVESTTAAPFILTTDLKALQIGFSKLLAYQASRGGVIGIGDNEPPPLTLTSSSDNDNASSNGLASTSQERRADPAAPAAAPATADGHAPPTNYRGLYRGFRRNTTGRRGRAAR
ncbi:E3 ubiquitin-protein ligase RNF25 [Manduca sexta]|uniref:E3 ubiquitin-protein ligase RNF25 n=1 Tax=Manduca sexta TaxID=7130 RepID=A0A922CFQ5_MANSE|nr:E3 ubiquitin-protein ligase RNF25 [Manduca sexta]KAG6444561.1 hypothetical protein O3G_MSEX003417 [Manduca sexta]